ncbi:MAG: hypothetical protein BZY82_07515 [SAR202 cluster bacterium Io17-Chloro-G3]|nr:MAG: hypothetical protein BZY82_07515 [SAR202 cluster bacterium Io17-Chloro-G3]
MPYMSGSQAVIQALRGEGIEVVFGLPGIQIMQIYDALFDVPTMRLITVRHEQTAVYMADGYARSTGKVGVGLVVPGPGVYNAGAALTTAYAASSQVLLVAGQIPSGGLGKNQGALHEVDDQLDIVRPVTKWSHRASTTQEIPAMIHEAMRQLRNGRPRPVEVEVAPDLLDSVVQIELIEPEKPFRPEPAAEDVEKAAALLASAKKPLIWAGGGVNLSDASSELQAVAELLRAPVVTTPEGQGALPYTHELLMGSMNYSWGPGRDLVPYADVVLGVGTRFGAHRRDPAEVLHPPQKLVNINVDESEFGKSYPVEVGIARDAKVTLNGLANALKGRKTASSWGKIELQDIKKRSRQRIRAAAPEQLSVIDGLRRVIPEDGIVVSGVTSMGAWGTIAFPTMRPRTYLTSSYMGTLGYSFPTALGAKVGNPDKPVVALCGDGGFLYAVAELATAVQYGINVVAVVFNNNQFGSTKRDQDLHYENRVIGTELRNPDFTRLAESFGAQGVRVEHLEELPRAVEEAIATDRPTVLEVTVADKALDPPYYTPIPGM